MLNEENIVMKKDFLVVYDYGTGGIWTVIHARSKEEIEQKFPDLKVMNDPRPDWMTDERFSELYDGVMKRRDYFYLDIDDKPTGWFARRKYNP